MKKLMIVAAGFTAMATATLTAETASAQAVTTSYTFTSVVTGDPANPFNGSFSLSNNAGSYSLTALSANYHSAVFNLGNSGLVQFDPTDVVIGGSLSGVLGVTANTNDFYLEFNPFTGAPQAFNVVSYAGGQTANRFTPTISIVPSTPTVSGAAPEPATWGMMILGFGVAGMALRRRRQVTTRVSYAI